jgi:hypothetical protein
VSTRQAPPDGRPAPQTPYRVSLARRQRAGRISRALGWVTLPLLVVGNTLYYVPNEPAYVTSVILQVVFVSLMLVHAGLSLYVFGFVRPARTLRVFHIYFGYATFVIVFASQLTIGMNPLHLVLNGLMYAALAGHVAIGVRYWLARRRAINSGSAQRTSAPLV